jgi:hypothetical protein
MELFCANSSFMCSYLSMYNIKKCILFSLFDFISCIVKNNVKNNISDETNSHIKNLEKILEICKYDSNMESRIDSFEINDFIESIISCGLMDSLNYFEVSGLIVFCDKNDCDDIYTFEECSRILVGLDKIKEYMKKYDSNESKYFSRVYKEKINDKSNDLSIYEIFKLSANTMEDVIIC